MPMIINTNMASLNAQHALSSTGNALQTSFQRLSTGLRINSAQDDAAGYAIANRMGALISSVGQAARNASDGISLAQTANSGMNTVLFGLQSLRTLAVQASNASNSAADRQALQIQVNQILADIQSTATSTQFNGVNLLDGSFSAQTFQIGAQAGQSVTVANLGNVQTSALGSGTTADVAAVGNQNALSSADLIINGVAIAASSALSDGLSFTSNASSGIAKAAAINAFSAQTGVSATASAAVAQGTSMTAAISAINVTINGVSIAITTTATSNAANRASVVGAINAYSGQTGVVAVDTNSDKDGVKLVAADGRNIRVTTVAAGATGLAAAGTYYGGYTLSSTGAITVTAGSGELAQAGLAAGTYSPMQAAVSSYNSAGATNAGVTLSALSSGDVTINGIVIGSSAGLDNISTSSNASSSLAKAAAINMVSAQTGVTATATNVIRGTAMTGAAVSAGTISINGVQVSISLTASSTAQNRQAVVTAINAVQGQTGVIATDTGTDSGGVTLTAADGRNIQLDVANLADTNTGLSTGTQYNLGSLKLTSTAAIKIDAGPTATNGVIAALGMFAGTYGAGRSGNALSSMDVTTASGALAALTSIDNAITSVNTFAANLGAIQNRFTSVVSSLSVYSNNLQAARSRITDTDFASETTALARNQVLQQAGTAMLAQANASMQQVMQLFR